MPSTPDLGAGDWLPSLRDIVGGVSHQARTLADHGRTAARLLGATTAAGARSLAIAAAGFARSVSDPDAGTEKSADGRGPEPTLDAVTVTGPDAEAAPDDGTVVEPGPTAGPAMEPAPTTISPEDPVFTADAETDGRDPDLSAAAGPGARGPAAFDGATEHLPGPDASGSGDETVSRRVAEVLYGDGEAGEGDPGPGDDEWTDRLESPEV